MLDSKGTVSSSMIIFREGKSIIRSGRKDVQRTLGGIVEPEGRGQSGRLRIYTFHASWLPWDKMALVGYMLAQKYRSG